MDLWSETAADRLDELLSPDGHYCLAQRQSVKCVWRKLQTLTVCRFRVPVDISKTALQADSRKGTRGLVGQLPARPPTHARRTEHNR